MKPFTKEQYQKLLANKPDEAGNLYPVLKMTDREGYVYALFTNVNPYMPDTIDGVFNFDPFYPPEWFMTINNIIYWTTKPFGGQSPEEYFVISEFKADFSISVYEKASCEDCTIITDVGKIDAFIRKWKAEELIEEERKLQQSMFEEEAF